MQIESEPIITEAQLNKQAENKIIGDIPLYKQLNIQAALIDGLVFAVHAMADKLGDPSLKLPNELIDEAVQMREFINSIRVNNARYKAFYEQSDDYVYLDSAKQSQLLSDQLEGGLHEIFGNEKRGTASA